MSIMDHEAQAFRRMLDNGMLPQPYTDADDRALRKAGIRLQGYGLTRRATLPPGWQVTQTDPRHGALIDDQGRVRGTFFYKEAPYETKGHLQMDCRYTTFSGRPGNYNWCAWDSASGTVLFEDPTASDHDQYERAKAWLNEHFPKWEDPSSYWNPTPDRRWWQFWK